MKKFDYENEQYLKKLDELPESNYSKYIAFIKQYLKSKDSKFLDIGCGNGKILSLLRENGYESGYGCDISKVFINAAKKKGLKNVFYYDGINFPFKENYFDLVGSFNVLEHVEDPEEFLESQVKILKKRGHIIVGCPNFLSVLYRNNHRRLKGVGRKLSNLLIIFSKLLSPSSKFEKIEPVKRKKFEYDDDAIVVTNLIDIKAVLSKNGCSLIYESGFINYDSLLFRLINRVPLIRYTLPSCFVVAKKIK